MRITYANDEIEAWDDTGHRIKGIKHATIILNQAGYTEVGLFFDRIELVALVGVKRSSDGVREERPKQ